jgi:electron-transferring-flavoprotein dehydrogenase
MRLKGIHLAMRSGMLAGETAFEAIRAGDTSHTTLSAYKRRVDASAIKSELYPVRNVHQAFGGGLISGGLYAGIAMVTKGKLLPELSETTDITRCARSTTTTASPSATSSCRPTPLRSTAS